MNTEQIETCLASARTMIFDNSWNRSKAPHVIAVVFKKFDEQTINMASYFKSFSGGDDVFMVLDTFLEGLIRFSLINKEQRAVYNSCFFPCSNEQFKFFNSRPELPEKVIYTFYQDGDNKQSGLLILEDGEPFFLYIPVYIQHSEYRSLKVV